MTITAAAGTVSVTSVTSVYSPLCYIHRMVSHQRDNSVTQRPKGCLTAVGGFGCPAGLAGHLCHPCISSGDFADCGREPGSPAASGLLQGFSGAADVNA